MLIMSKKVLTIQYNVVSNNIKKEINEKIFNRIFEKKSDVNYYLLLKSLIIMGEDNIMGSVCWKMFKRSFLFNNNIRFNTNIEMDEDLLFIIQSLKYKPKITFANEHLYNYRKHATSSTVNLRQKNLVDNYKDLYNKMIEIILAIDYIELENKNKLINYAKFMRYYIIIISVIVYFPLSKIFKRKNNKIIIGSWGGKYYSDNAKYLFEFILKKHPNKDVYWVGNKKLIKENNIDKKNFLKKYSIKKLYHLLTCKYIFVTQSLSYDVANFPNLYRGAIKVQLWHGVPIKKIGCDRNKKNKNTIIEGSIKPKNNVSKKLKTIIKKLYSSDDYDYYISTSKIYTNIFQSAFRYKLLRENNFINSGYPRNDILLNYSMDLKTKIKDKYYELLKIEKTKKIILYLPTFRKKGSEIFSFVNLSNKRNEDIHDIIKDKYIILENNHIIEKNLKDFNKNLDNDISMNINKYKNKIDIQELMLISDILISDYSGAIFDYVLLDRPIIHFVYDYEQYKIDFGLYYEYPEFASGDVAYDFNGLLTSLNQIVNGEDLYFYRRKFIKDKYMSYEDGNASKKICEFLEINNKKGDAK